MSEFDDYTLGETNEAIEVDTSTVNRDVTIRMVDQCRRVLDITSRELDPAIYDTAEFIDAVKKLALRSRYSKIRIIVMNPEPVFSRGHRLLELANKLSTYIEIKRPGPEQKDFNEAMLIADETGVIHRTLSDRYDGVANFNDKRLAEDLTRRFDELWAHAVPEANFRRLMM